MQKALALPIMELEHTPTHVCAHARMHVRMHARWALGLCSNAQPPAKQLLQFIAVLVGLRPRDYCVPCRPEVCASCRARALCRPVHPPLHRQDVKNKERDYTNYQELFGLAVSRIEEILDVSRDVQDKYKLWTALREWQKITTEWISTRFNSINPDEVCTDAVPPPSRMNICTDGGGGGKRRPS